MTFICGNADEQAYREVLGEDEPDAIDRLIEELSEEDDGLTWAQIRERFTQISDEVKQWEGIPIPLPGNRLILHKYHPMHDRVIEWNEAEEPRVEIIIGGPASQDPAETPEELVQGIVDRITGEDIPEKEWVRNRWYSRKKQAYIYIYQRGDKVFHAEKLRSADRSMDRLTIALETLGVIDAWDLSAEYKARQKLIGMISEHQWRMYELTGSFVEYSKRSRLYYIFRKGRPTIVMTERVKEGWKSDRLHMLAVLCLHPIGYYAGTWAGCMTPTDDVIAHLLLMRGDEAEYWGQANQHRPESPEAGL